MDDDHRNEPPAKSGERASGSIVKRRAYGDEAVADPYRDIRGYPDDPGAEAGIDLRNILRIAVKRKWLIGGSIAACLVCGLLWTLLQKPLVHGEHSTGDRSQRPPNPESGRHRARVEQGQILAPNGHRVAQEPQSRATRGVDGARWR